MWGVGIKLAGAEQAANSRQQAVHSERAAMVRAGAAQAAAAERD